MHVWASCCRAMRQVTAFWTFCLESLHAPRSIWNRSTDQGSGLIPMAAINHKMELVAHSLCLVSSTPLKVAQAATGYVGDDPSKRSPMKFLLSATAIDGTIMILSFCFQPRSSTESLCQGSINLQSLVSSMPSKRAPTTSQYGKR